MIYFTDIDGQGLELNINGYRFPFSLLRAVAQPERDAVNAVIKICGANDEDVKLIRECYDAYSSINTFAECSHIAYQALAQYLLKSFPAPNAL